ncbi:lipase family protein [Pontibacter harenae]|uniref:lipase family protein n=1 Tax=Pontibacter harenae TaxID=2894083 RepID=UPI001E456EA6|nr:lipase family protein [Pontibacter harenae]MCC9168147.1 lipase family protein [Pontibacter harenae]
MLVLKHILTYTLLLSSLLSTTACEKEPIASPETIATTTPKTNFYVSSELLLSVPKDMLQSVANSQGYSVYTNEIKYGVDVYKLEYTTTYQGHAIKASGLVVVPQNMTTPAPVISAQHGTIFTQSEAPSNFKGLSGFELFSAAGYVTLIPDYIGFGASAEIFHPYYDQKHSALAVVDMIKAAKSFYKEKEIQVNDKLFLAGYSEGGFVTLAAQKEIETNPTHGLKVTASAAGAGGYDLVSMLQGVKSGKSYSYPAYLVYVLQSYNKTNNWNRPLSDFFQEPYASKLEGLLNGKNSGGSINRELTTDPKKLFAPAFFAALSDASKEQPLKQALQANSFFDWVPQSPTRLYHGTTDNIVPFENSKQTYERFKAQGAKQLEFIPIEGKSHGTAFAPMLQDMVPWIKSFK